jgi:hypothetical protein
MIEEIKNYTEKIDTTNIAEELDTLKQDFVDWNERYVIPPIIKNVYQKFINIKTKDDIANIVFNDLEWTALKAKNSEFWNEKYQTWFFGKKMYESFKEVFPNLQQKLSEGNEVYKMEHPEEKFSTKELEILNNPIEMNDIKVSIGNISYIFTELSIAGEKIATCKPIKDAKGGENIYIDVRSVYSYGTSGTKRSPIVISSVWDNEPQLHDSNNIALNGRYLVGVDGNMYAIDENMRVVHADGTPRDLLWNEEYQRYDYDRNMYKWFWNGEFVKDNTEYIVSLQYNGEKITHQQQNIKKEKYMSLYQDYSKEKNQGYIMKYNDNGSCYIEKNGVKSINSNNILSYTEKEFTDWIQEAEKGLEEKIITNEKERSAPEKKQEIFEEYKKIYCVEDAKEENSVFELKADYLPKRAENDVNKNRKYGIKLWYRNNDPQNEAYLIIVDMDKNTEVIGATVVFQLTDVNWKKIVKENIYISSYIPYHILEYEKNEPK